MNNHLKSILKVCIFVLAFVGALLSISLPFITKQNDIKISAVSVRPCDSEQTDVYFSTSNFLIPVAFSLGDENSALVDSYGVSFASLNINLYYISNRTDFEIDVVSASTNVLDNQYGYLPSVSSTLSVGNATNTPTSWVHSYLLVNNFVNSQYTISDLFLNYNYRNFNFNGTVAYITIFYTSTINQRVDGTVIKFYDTGSGSFEFQFFGGSNSNPHPYFNYSSYVPARTIYIIQDLTDNQYYDSGYNSGYIKGVSDGSDGGYDIGYNKGYQNGLIVGYDNGLNAQDIYSFGNLLTAVVDAPVGVFISMLDFNIMGFNLLNLVVGLLTLAVICLVVKLILGGK